MRELTKSIGSFSWAMSLFGVRQMANAMRPSRATEAFDSVTEATEGELGDLLRSAFELGDRMQRGFVDMTFGMASMEMLDPRNWTRTMGEMAGNAARTMSGMVPGANPAARGGETGWGPMPGSRPGAAPSAAPAGGGSGHGSGTAGSGGWGPMGP